MKQCFHFKKAFQDNIGNYCQFKNLDVFLLWPRSWKYGRLKLNFHCSSSLTYPLSKQTFQKLLELRQKSRQTMIIFLEWLATWQCMRDAESLVSTAWTHLSMHNKHLISVITSHSGKSKQHFFTWGAKLTRMLNFPMTAMLHIFCFKFDSRRLQLSFWWRVFTKCGLKRLIVGQSHRELYSSRL
jgi:hypothetical protein